MGIVLAWRALFLKYFIFHIRSGKDLRKKRLSYKEIRKEKEAASPRKTKHFDLKTSVQSSNRSSSVLGSSSVLLSNRSSALHRQSDRVLLGSSSVLSSDRSSFLRRQSDRVHRRSQSDFRQIVLLFFVVSQIGFCVVRSFLFFRYQNQVLET
ncbi:hypothetical protein SO802_018723 [Lithocarpus litseifolius]|uniref:Transmembrane protein n=1 Tax=Lithocarpus litseifolius TaxID=425828 RepID=A0AAW2CRC3_9ROSI